jgi:neurotransmitter:Na+ symporter, NSS family
MSLSSRRISFSSRERTITKKLSSRASFYLVTIGAAVGLGSIWRFPYLAGKYGGGLFVATFLGVCMVIAVPLLVAEFFIGQVSRQSPPRAAGAVAALAGLGRRWDTIGALGSLSAFLVFSYYTMIAGWVVAYAFQTARGDLTGLSSDAITAGFHGFLGSPLRVFAWQLGFVVLTGLVSSLGLHGGIERISKFRAPALLVLLLILVAYSLYVGDTARGLSFAFSPRTHTLSGEMLLAAVSQAFYATGVGMAMMIAYGAYIPGGTSLFRSAIFVVASIMIVSILATLVIFPLVFRYHLDPAQGPKLVFEVLPTAFAEMPAGRLIGTVFFTLLALAAVTPAIAALEPTVAWLENRGTGRVRAVLWVCIAGAGVGLGSVFSFNIWADWRPLGFVPGFGARSFFDIVDFISSDLLLPVGALCTCIFVGWVLPGRLTATPTDPSAPRIHPALRFLLRFVCPIAIVGVVIGAFL